MTADAALSICVPFYGKPAEIVSRAIASAARAMPSESELLVFPNGAQACSDLRRVALPAQARVFESHQELELVENWNRCLSSSRGNLIHILHDDDVVAPDFYTSILELQRRFPTATLYGTGTAPINAERVRAGPFEPPFFLDGDEAAYFILEDERFSVGSVVLTRLVVDAKGPFREEFAYCPDEEAFPRYAREGGFAVNPAPLYLSTTDEHQARYSDWRRPDFVASYVRSRVEGAAAFSPTVVERARESSARRVVTVAVSLALQGDDDLALRQLDELGRIVPACRRSLRYWLARAVAKSPLLRRAAGFRRRHVAGARTSLHPT